MPVRPYQPAIIAQSAATIAILSDRRFTLGLGGRAPERARGRQGWPAVESARSGKCRSPTQPRRPEAAISTVREDVAEVVGCGPEPEAHLQVIQQFLDVGFDAIAVVQVRDDKDGFIDFWQSELAPRLRLRRAGGPGERAKTAIRSVRRTPDVAHSAQPGGLR